MGFFQFRDVRMAGMIRVCECINKLIISINKRYFLTVRVTASF